MTPVLAAARRLLELHDPEAEPNQATFRRWDEWYDAKLRHEAAQRAAWDALYRAVTIPRHAEPCEGQLALEVS